MFHQSRSKELDFSKDKIAKCGVIILLTPAFFPMTVFSDFCKISQNQSNQKLHNTSFFSTTKSI